MNRVGWLGSIAAAMCACAALVACKKEATSDSAPVAAASAAVSVGIAECDEYLTKYERCVSEKVPEASRAQPRRSVEMMRAGWQQAALNPATKASNKATHAGAVRWRNRVWETSPLREQTI